MRFIFLTDKSTFRALSLDRSRTVDFWRLLNDVDGFASSVLDSLLNHWWIGHLCFLGLLGTAIVTTRDLHPRLKHLRVEEYAVWRSI